ncbi:MAG: PDZ domain-containing protein [Myxococcales bacterium]|nr:PDZ domain-containing protein [Myxococcota bacterium]MDW8281427.1 PDZ domain-containing protein [Myxococcales bacterium]
MSKGILTRLIPGSALFGLGVVLALACTKVKVSWDQPASASPPTLPGAVAPALPPPTAAQIEGARALSRTFSQVAEQVGPSVVAIKVEKKQKGVRFRRLNPFRDFPFPFPFGFPDEEDGGGEEDEDSGPVQRGAGSGVVVDTAGHILTNNHVVSGADSIKVKFADGRELSAKIVGTDPRSDLAVIKVDAKGYQLKPARLGDSDKMLVGEWVIAIGNPFGLDHTVTVGVISAKGRSGIGDMRTFYQDFLQTDASINPGNSGGPLVNLAGEVIGINTAILGPGGNIGIGFAVPSDMAKPIMRELIATGKVRRPFLGISMQEYNPDLARAMGGPEKGALVQGLTPGGPAEKAGVKRGDVITAVDGKKVDSSRDVQRQVLSRNVGDTVVLNVWRDGKSLTIQVKAGELPNDDKAVVSGGGTDEQGKTRARLGLSLQTLTPQLAERLGLKVQAGVLISGVKPGSPASEANLARGDVILEIDKKPVRTVEEAIKALSTERPGGHVLLVQKGDQAFFVLLQPPGQ